MKMNRKGITPIIAIILLLMMTVAAAGSAFYWLIKVQGELQGGTEQYQETTFKTMAATVNWQSADYNSTSEILTIYLRNVGTVEVPLDNGTAAPTTTWILFDNELRGVCQTNWNAVTCTEGCGTSTVLQESDTTRVKLNLSGTNCDLSSYSSGTLMRANIYFSGTATTSGTFER